MKTCVNLYLLGERKKNTFLMKIVSIFEQKAVKWYKKKRFLC